MSKITLAEARKALAIDPDDLYECLVEQPEWYYHVSEQHELAVAERDAIQLELDETLAEMDEQLRKTAIASKEDVTEPMMKHRLRALPKVKELCRELLAAKAEVGRWAAMVKGFDKRGSMLSKIVDREESQLYALGIERGASNTKSKLAENVRQRQTLEQDR
jgi:hypothetical protein